jgi:hypothetical protein
MVRTASRANHPDPVGPGDAFGGGRRRVAQSVAREGEPMIMATGPVMVGEESSPPRRVRRTGPESRRDGHEAGQDDTELRVGDEFCRRMPVAWKEAI